MVVTPGPRKYNDSSVECNFLNLMRKIEMPISSLPDIVYFVLGTFLITNLVFWGFNAILLLLDTSNGPISQYLRKYKIQEDKNVPLHRQKLWTAVRLVFFNQTVVALPLFILLYPISKWRGITLEKPFPSISIFLCHLLICVITEEVAFYYFHRILHHPYLYKRFHKKHHEWTAPIGIVAIYAHPIEHVFANLLPPYLGVFIAGSGLKFAWFWFCFALIFTSNTHSGYHFPFVASAEAHDFHHAKFDNCFGVLGILDYLHGTDKKFRETINCKRNRFLWTLTPAKQLYPK